MIGIFPQMFFKVLMKPVSQFVSTIPLAGTEVVHFEVINKIGLFSLAFIVLAALVFTIRRFANSNKILEKEETWGCGYVAPGNKMQYTASSFVRSYRKLAEPVLMFKKNKKEINGIFPSEGEHEIHPLDKIEEYLIQQPLRQFRLLLSKFLFLQNGKLQFYVLYGMIFIMVIIGIPFIISAIKIFIKFLSA